MERLERATDTQARQLADGLQQAQETHRDLEAARQAEEAKFRQAMVALFQDQQHKTEHALRPMIGKAWRGLVATTAGLALLFFGFYLLLTHEYRRL